MLSSLKAHRVNPKKLLDSKWTAVKPINKERHFMVVQLIDDENIPGQLDQVVLEAVLTKRQWTYKWQKLLDPLVWMQGWK